MEGLYEAIQLVDNKQRNRFELTVNGFTAFIEYRTRGTRISLIHTEVPEQLQGKGVAPALIGKTLAYLKAQEYSLLPICPVVVKYIRRHPEWLSIVIGKESADF